MYQGSILTESTGMTTLQPNSPDEPFAAYGERTERRALDNLLADIDATPAPDVDAELAKLRATLPKGWDAVAEYTRRAHSYQYSSYPRQEWRVYVLPNPGECGMGTAADFESAAGSAIADLSPEHAAELAAFRAELAAQLEAHDAMCETDR